jgi:hypothetical protein
VVALEHRQRAKVAGDLGDAVARARLPRERQALLEVAACGGEVALL